MVQSANAVNSFFSAKMKATCFTWLVWTL